MKYVDEFRNREVAQALYHKLHTLASQLDDDLRIMEVCGSHTMAIARYGLRSLLPPGIKLISGPGCPVCVTDAGYIDAACTLAGTGVIIATFGDMMKVPGSFSTLARCRLEGGAVHVCYSPLEALQLAAANPQKEVVFLGIGFETTIPPVLSLLERAAEQELQNVSVLTAFKTIPPALALLAADPEVRVNAFLCPAHVSTVIGSNAYEPIAARFRLPCVVAGFEPLDILLGLCGILEQKIAGVARVENQYARVVKPEGNQRAQQLIEKYLLPADVHWRGLGVLPGSGLTLREEFGAVNAEVKLGAAVQPGKPNGACRCGDVLKGIIEPPECRLFGRGCTPQHPIGPCMVSSEGSCAARYKYAEGV